MHICIPTPNTGNPIVAMVEVMTKPDYSKFQDLTFDDFRAFAADDKLSKYEKIGFPNAYREGKEKAIFQDILHKLPSLNRRNQTIIDIGPGCSDLPQMMIKHCERQDHELILIDAQEVLDQLPDKPWVTKLSAHYPDECETLFTQYAGQVHAILSYSVLHYVFTEGRLFEFFDRSLPLLADNGAMLVGDIPNISKRKRFFDSPTGVRYHQAFTETDEKPDVHFNTLEPGNIDDGILLAIITRYRQAGFDVYCLPQPDELPMANRREDLLIRKP
jgi:hypothetical protein